MKTTNKKIKNILNEPSYWVEGINGSLYDSIIRYMEENGLNRTELSKHLGISKGRVSQILNDGEINFSIVKLIEISLKIGKYPIFELKNIEEHIKDVSDYRDVIDFNTNYFVVDKNKSKSTSFTKTKIIPITNEKAKKRNWV